MKLNCSLYINLIRLHFYFSALFLFIYPFSQSFTFTIQSFLRFRVLFFDTEFFFHLQWSDWFRIYFLLQFSFVMYSRYYIVAHGLKIYLFIFISLYKRDCWKVQGSWGPHCCLAEDLVDMVFIVFLFFVKNLLYSNSSVLNSITCMHCHPAAQLSNYNHCILLIQALLFNESAAFCFSIAIGG